MAFKFLTLCALVAVVRSGAVLAPAPLTYAAPVAKLTVATPTFAKVSDHSEDYDPNPQYSFAYDIQDGLTGDSKSQQETRSGDVVSGSYSLVDPDGHKRTVEYTADPQNGFNAVVRREPLGHKVIAAAPVIATAKVINPVAHYAAAPVAQYAAAPVAQYAAAPVSHYAAAPVAHYAAAPVSQYSAAPLTNYATAPVAHFAAAPFTHYAAAPVAHYATAPIAHSYHH